MIDHLRVRTLSYVTEFTAHIPYALKPGRLYVDPLRVAVHLCACGCGEKVITPTGSERWQWLISYMAPRNEATLRPDITCAKCGSRYTIRNGKVEWYGEGAA